MALTGPNDARDLMIQTSRDLRRTIDYLETRADIDTRRLAYYGLSWGAHWGPVFTAVESRFSASVLRTEIEPMFALQGAPREHKRLVVLDGGHVPESPNPFIREILDGLDRYLGPVERR